MSVPRVPMKGRLLRALPEDRPDAHTGSMTAEPVITGIDARDDGNVPCWCCGTVDAPDQMVHLGNHPEVHLCLRCAHFVHQRAWEIEDVGKVGPTAFVRDWFRNLRAEVMRRGWHQNRFIGGNLRWLGKYLP
jgi:hypothetical protein